MSGGGSKSSSKSTTTTKTNQYDQRVSATDLGLAIGSGVDFAGDVSVQQIPPVVGDIFSQLLANNTQLINVATAAGESAVNRANSEADEIQTDSRKWLLFGALGVVLIIGVMKG